MSDPGRFQDDIDKARDLLNANPPELQRRRAGNGGTIPPAEHRFKPGQSGNPGGRPKRVFSDLLTAYELIVSHLGRLAVDLNAQPLLAEKGADA